MSGGSVQLSSQGQALDGYAGLAAFRYIAAKARIALALAQPEPTALTGPALEDLRSIELLLEEHEMVACTLNIRRVLEAQPEPLAPRPLKERPDFIAGYTEGLADRKRITEHEEAERPPANQPVPVSERLPGPEDCDANGRCWLTSVDVEPGWVTDNPEQCTNWTHWLPHWALPVPTPAIAAELEAMP
jgi:hypothetical protein